MTTNRTLDRVVHFDERSRNFPIRAAINTGAFKTTTWDCHTYNDQGTQGACVGFGWSHELAAQPYPVPTNATLATQIYKRAQQLDVWPGEDYSGTSVLGGAKAVSELRNNIGEPYISEYRWAFGISDVLLALSHQGPVVLGLNWYSGMFDTDYYGYLRVSGSLAGGHCLLATGVNLEPAPDHEGEMTELSHIDPSGSYIILHNSWGKDWGVGGKARMTLQDMTRLLSEQGEACVPMVRAVDFVEPPVIVVEDEPAEPDVPTPPPVPKPKKQANFFSASRSNVFHGSHPGIRQQRKFSSYEEARRKNLRPCNVCRPQPEE